MAVRTASGQVDADMAASGRAGRLQQTRSNRKIGASLPRTPSATGREGGRRKVRESLTPTPLEILFRLHGQVRISRNERESRWRWWPSSLQERAPSKHSNVWPPTYRRQQLHR